jgi:hypothetical protein
VPDAAAGPCNFQFSFPPHHVQQSFGAHVLQGRLQRAVPIRSDKTQIVPQVVAYTSALDWRKKLVDLSGGAMLAGTWQGY